MVRDNIPDIIKNNGEEPIIRILGEDEYRKELYKKLKEEVNEVIKSENKKETLLELVDVLEVLKAIAELNDKKMDDIIDTAEQKRLKRGGFKKRLFKKNVLNMYNFHYFDI